MQARLFILVIQGYFKAPWVGRLFLREQVLQKPAMLRPLSMYRGGGDGGSGSSKRPGERGGFGRFNPVTKKIEIANPNLDKNILANIDVPENLWLKYKKIPTIADSGSGKGETPTTDPKVDPKDVPPIKEVITEIYHECSCTAQSFTLKELPANIFFCPNYGMKKEVNNLSDAAGNKYKVTSYTPPEDSCNKKPSSDESSAFYFWCGCEDTNAYIEKLKKTFECPKNGDSKEYKEENGLMVYILKSSKLECDMKFQCPKGYEWDWEKLVNNCLKAKQKECGAPDTLLNTVPGEQEMCDALSVDTSSYWKNLECVDFENCKETVKIFKSSNNWYEELKEKKLPSLSSCQDLYGKADTGVWD